MWKNVDNHPTRFLFLMISLLLAASIDLPGGRSAISQMMGIGINRARMLVWAGAEQHDIVI
jgi:hypothetical protein